MEVNDMRGKSYDKNDKKVSNRSKKGKSTKKWDDSAKLDPKGRDNDPNFYFTNAELAQQAAQLSFQSVLGLDNLHGYRVPTIMRILTNPCPGNSYQQRGFNGNPAWMEIGYPKSFDDDKHGINLMSSKLYTMLSTFTGRTSQYAPQDVAMMVLSISSIAELSEHIRRAFGIALTYNPRNRTLPLGLLRSMGIDVSDFLANIPAYRMRFNIAMTRINQIPLLDNIGYIKKSREIYQRVYMDSVSPMSQIFYYAPRTVWQLNEIGDGNGSVLDQVTIIGDTNTFKKTIGQLIGYLENMITALLESSTLNLIYADLLNMANKIKVPVWQFDYLAENYVVMPEFNANALLQLHHVRVMGVPLALNTNTYSATDKWIYDPEDSTKKLAKDMTLTNQNCVVCNPDKNNIMYNPIFKDTSWPYGIVDMHTPDPTLEDRIESLRFTAISSGSKIVASQIVDGAPSLFADILPALPDHYVTDITIFSNIDYSDNTMTFASNLSTNIVARGSYLTFEDIEAYSKFNSAPMLIVTDGSSTPSSTDVTYHFGDLDFYTEIDFDYLSRLNEMMYTGLFDFRV